MNNYNVCIICRVTDVEAPALLRENRRIGHVICEYEENGILYYAVLIPIERVYRSETAIFKPMASGLYVFRDGAVIFISGV